MSTGLTINNRLAAVNTSYAESISTLSNVGGGGYRKHKNLIDLKEGIAGIRNNSFYCYLNAFMQCLAPITQMRDHYLTQEYAKYKETRTKRDDFNFCNGLYLFYKAMYRSETQYIEIRHLKDTVAKKFHPILQHDSHEFMAYLLSNLQDEETPVEGSQFDGSQEGK